MGQELSNYDLAINALSQIVWTKDCGIDGVVHTPDGDRIVNYTADERDAMYRIAKKALAVIADRGDGE